MKNENYKSYRIKNNNTDNLIWLGFKHIGDGIYIHNFPCYKWNGYVTITGRFTAYDEKKDIIIDVYQEDGRPYSPYYSNTDSNSEVLAIIHSNINKERKRCGIDCIS